MDESQEIQQILSDFELGIMRLHPDKYVPEYVKSIRDIFKYRHTLKQTKYTQESFDYMIDIISNAVEKGIRFKTLDTLLVVKKIKKNASENLKLPARIVDKLFDLYKSFINHTNAEVVMAISVLLKDQVLSNWQIQWLLDECDENDNILNRVLLYPEKHPLITEWAREVYKDKRHINRQSEIIALLIDDDIPDYINMSDRATILWAIFRAKVSDDTRKRLLKKSWDLDSLNSLVEICNRLEYLDVLEYVMAEIKSGKTVGD